MRLPDPDLGLGLGLVGLHLASRLTSQLDVPDGLMPARLEASVALMGEANIFLVILTGAMDGRSAAVINFRLIWGGAKITAFQNKERCR